MKKVGFNIKIYEKYLEIKKVDLKNIQSFNLNFSEMTDTFMTACIFASLIPKKSTIFGIKNQKVKECNRIKSMVKNF